MSVKVSGKEFARVAYEMAVESTGVNDTETPKIVYPGRGLTPVLGTMDCQAFVEACLKECGYSHNWTGSNAMWRDMQWKGTPEECKKQFGRIPEGAWLFIWTSDTSSALPKYQKDGEGNATHVGVYTGQGKGAAHSSSSRKGVCQSAFKGSTIKNGGWNRIGLPAFMDYGTTVEPSDSDTGTDDAMPDNEPYEARINADRVKFRISPSQSSQWWDILEINTVVQVIGTVNAKWSEVVYGKHDGYIMTQFLSKTSKEDSTPSGEGKETGMTKKQVYSADGGSVFMRPTPKKGGTWIARLPVGTIVDASESINGWTQIIYNGKAGYMMTEFLTDVSDVQPPVPEDQGTDERTILDRLIALEQWRAAMEQRYPLG